MITRSTAIVWSVGIALLSTIASGFVVVNPTCIARNGKFFSAVAEPEIDTATAVKARDNIRYVIV